MASATPGPSPPIYVEGQVTQPPNFSLTCVSALPAKFSTTLRVDVLLSTGLPQSANVEVTLDAFVAVGAQNTGYLRSFARSAAELNINAPDLDPGRNFVRAGRYTVQTMTQEGLLPGT
ncbi:hypothetical protein [Bradyrhizobium tropiciagri]|uniref:hypothetical protein n=1 Tax=Bradyrhizobium tropiciagri TaxID=312253 RepID=UPI00100997C1|nr:hypothetical protein [Bradyrhizobium tropiciagri]